MPAGRLFMQNRIGDKINVIETYLKELEGIAPNSFRAYEKDFKTKAACERYFEKIIEAIVDLAFLLIKTNNFKIPEDDKEAFDVLAAEAVISKDLAAKLKDAKGMRNIIAHKYGNIDDKIVFESITKELNKAAVEFLAVVKAKA